MEIYERLFITMDEKGIPQTEIVDNLSDVTKSTVSAWKTRRTDPPARFIAPICKLLGVSVEYLLTGEVSKDSTICFPKSAIPESDVKLLEMYHKLPDNKQTEIVAYIQNILAVLETNIQSESERELLEMYRQLPSNMQADVKSDIRAKQYEIKYKSNDKKSESEAV